MDFVPSLDTEESGNPAKNNRFVVSQHHTALFRGDQN
jgi:hypothetical protein